MQNFLKTIKKLQTKTVVHIFVERILLLELEKPSLGSKGIVGWSKKYDEIYKIWEIWKITLYIYTNVGDSGNLWVPSFEHFLKIINPARYMKKNADIRLFYQQLPFKWKFCFSHSVHLTSMLNMLAFLFV